MERDVEITIRPDAREILLRRQVRMMAAEIAQWRVWYASISTTDAPATDVRDIVGEFEAKAAGVGGG